MAFTNLAKVDATDAPNATAVEYIESVEPGGTSSDFRVFPIFPRPAFTLELDRVPVVRRKGE